MSATTPGSTSGIPSYIPIPPSATLISTPSSPVQQRRSTLAVSAKDIGGGSSSTPTPSAGPGLSTGTASGHASLPIFPPGASNASSSSGTRKFAVPMPAASAISTNVSDMLLSSLLPTNLPKLPNASNRGSGQGQGQGQGQGPGRPRALNTQREGLSLPVMSNNFRRFVTKVGPVFWLQDRIEEVMFWRKPMWTWAWLMAWTAVSFQPRLLLLAPFLALLLTLLHISERAQPVASLLGVSMSAPPAGTTRVSTKQLNKDVPSVPLGSGSGASMTTGSEGEAVPAVPPKEAESGVDYYMNLQAIQNTMGWVSDAYDEVAPILAQITSPNRSPTSLPLTPTHIILMLLPPSLLLPLSPPWLIPYILLPIGWAPTFAFHPNLVPLFASIPHTLAFRRARALLANLLLTDTLPDDIARHPISFVEVWENERLDPAITSKLSSSSSAGSQGMAAALPPGSWSYRHLRAGERLPWVKCRTITTPASTSAGFTGSGDQARKTIRRLSKATSEGGRPESSMSTSMGRTGIGLFGEEAFAFGQGMEEEYESPWYDPQESLPVPDQIQSQHQQQHQHGGATSHAHVQAQEEGKSALRLKADWTWIPGEDWRVDMAALWSERGVDEEGWVYTDDSWQNPAPLPMSDADVSGPMPALRRSTRRRKWWRRVYRRDTEK